MDDDRFMDEALRLAQRAAEAGEVPVGAVIVKDGRILARAHNQVETLRDATAHAEMIAITQAAEALENWRLDGADLFVTLEPCAMCAGAASPGSSTGPTTPSRAPAAASSTSWPRSA
jgi:tRNA(adenine34) deaminase